MKKLLSLTIIMTAFVICGCNDNEIHLNSISVRPQTLIIHPGENAAILDVYLYYDNGSKIHYEDANPNTIQWKSNNPGVVEVIDGIVYGIKFGTALITATAKGASPLEYSPKIRVYVVEDEDTQYFGPAMLDLTDVTTTTASFRTYIDINEDDEYAFVYCKGGLILLMTYWKPRTQRRLS